MTIGASGPSSPRIVRSKYWQSWAGPAAVTLVAAGAVIFDTLTPQSFSVTAVYVGLVLVGYWLRDPRSALALALLATPLVVIGHWTSIPDSVPEWESWGNRGDTIGSVWLTAFFVWRIRVLEQKLQRQLDLVERSEAQISALAGEAEHRAKNILANVKAMIHLSQSDTPDGLKEAIEGRISALAGVHSLFAKSRWAGAELGRLIKEELSPYSQHGQTRTLIDGPAIMLKPDLAQTIAVALHELATNAAKYGALSVDAGQVRVEWSRAAGADGRFVLRWTEAGGPPVKPPTRKGFGTHVMATMIRRHEGGDVHLHWHAEGLVCEIALPA